MKTFLWLAIFLVIAWVVLRVALAITSGVLHLLWIAAVLFFIMSLVSKFRASRTR